MANPLRILHVDDNAFDRAVVLGVLAHELEDAFVHQVADEPGLIDALEAGNFDVVLTDYLLPWIDGLAILRLCKERWPDVPVLMVTGSGDEEVAIQAMKAGLDDYILKSPKHLARLPVAIKSALDRVEQRERLAASEVRFRDLFSRVPVGLYRSTRDGTFVDVNPTLAEILGYPTRDALMAVPVLDLYVDATDRVRWQVRIERDGVVRQFETALRRMDGSVAWVRGGARAVRDAEGRIIGYEGSVEDVTERKRAEVALARRMRQLDTMRGATQEITRELDLTVLPDLIVRRATELVGGASGSLFLWDETRQAVLPRARCGDHPLCWADAWRAGEGIIGGVVQRRAGIVLRDDHASADFGELSRAHRWATSLIAEPVLYGDRLLGVLAAATGGTLARYTTSDANVLGLFAVQAAVAIENARLFAQVSESAREWENTFDAAADMIAVVDPEGRIRRANDAFARRAGLTPAALVGRRCDEVLDWQDGPSRQSALARCLESGRPITEEREVTRTGESFVQTCSPFLDVRGGMRGVVQIITDVTRQRQLQRQLSRSERMAAMGQLISGVAHELNNPLTTILGNAQLLALGAANERAHQQAAAVAHEAERAAGIVRNLLAFARPCTPQRRALSLEHLIERILAQRTPGQDAHEVAVILVPGPPVPPVSADPDQIWRVFVNLLANAEHAAGSRPGGEVRIILSADPAHAFATAAVVDNGPGIPADILGRIFDPFFTTKEGAGTGLGLAVCYAILREHGGKIRASNRAEGGACLEFDLPVAAAGAAPEEDSTRRPVPAARSARRKRILVIDDQENIARMAAGALRMVGHHVVIATDGPQAAATLARETFDVVVMDMKMPGFDGERIYEDVIRRQAAPPRVVIMTGDTANAQTRTFLDRTGLRCVEKPFTVESLWACVRDEGDDPLPPLHPPVPAPPSK